MNERDVRVNKQRRLATEPRRRASATFEQDGRPASSSRGGSPRGDRPEPHNRLIQSHGAAISSGLGRHHSNLPEFC